jgi:hypothetical protein
VGPQKNIRPVIFFHNISHARAIAAAMHDLDVPVDAVTAPGAVRSLGATILKSLADAAKLSEALIDCGSSSESVQLSLRAGWRRILFEAPHPAYEKLSELAKFQDGEILPRSVFLNHAPATLDLLRDQGPLQSCKEFLKNFSA